MNERDDKKGSREDDERQDLDDRSSSADDRDSDGVSAADQGEPLSDAFATTSDVRSMPTVHRDGSAAPFGYALAVTACVSVAFHFGFAPDIAFKAFPLVILVATYGVFTAIAVYRFSKQGKLATLRPRGGDVSIGAMVAAILWGLGWATVKVALVGTPHEGWVFNLYRRLGDPTESATHHLVSVAVLFIGGLEEITWRGLVLESLETRLGVGRASLITAGLWAASHVPTMYRLSDPICGYNPMLVGAAFGCGLVWAYLRFRMKRLAPAVLSHCIFSWAMIEFPVWHLH